jgi:protein TonB
MLRPCLSYFLVVSLAVHAAALLLVRNDTQARNWLAGPVIVRLVTLPASLKESRPVTSKKATTADKTVQAAASHGTASAKNNPPQRRPARIPAALPAAMENLPDTDVSTDPAEWQAAEIANPAAEREQRLLDSLHAALMPHFSYPLLARRRGWEGIVRVGVRIEANGSLTRLHLVEPSPYDVLNTAAINSLSRLARLQNAGNWLQGRHVDLVLPVEYRLLEG